MSEVLFYNIIYALAAIFGAITVYITFFAFKKR